MKLTYWYIEHENDSNCYSIRTRTKKRALELANEHWDNTAYVIANVRKVTVHYDNAFDLMKQCVGEGGLICEF